MITNISICLLYQLPSHINLYYYHFSQIPFVDNLLYNTRIVFSWNDIELTFSAECLADVVLAIDRSGSMSGEYSTVLNFVKTIVSGFELSHNRKRVGIIVFNNYASVEVSEDQSNYAMIMIISILTVTEYR